MVLVLLLAAAVAASPVAEDAVPAVVGAEGAVVGAEGADRDAKLFSVFQIIKFNNDECTALDGSKGSCYTSAECTSKGGTDGGKCAAGFGVCCISIFDPNCPAAVIELSPTTLVNPGYPDELDTTATCAAQATNGRRQISRQQPRIFFPKPTTTVATTDIVSGPISYPKEYEYKIKKISDDVVQMRIDFLVFDIAPPLNGECSNETIVITGVDPITERVLPAALCGVLTGQHMYVSVKEHGADDVLLITITVTDDRDQKWQIRVTQIESTETEALAPRGCLQYHKEESGTLESFNNNAGTPEVINNLDYSICLKDMEGFCDVSLLSTGTFDLNKATDGTCDDFISFGGKAYCGSTFANAGSLTWNYTGPYSISVLHDGDSTAMNEGFSIDFIKLPC